MPVNSTHEQYDESASKLLLVRNCIAGSEQMKAAGYITNPAPNDDSEQNASRYKRYVNDALFVNYTARTLNATIGQAFRVLPQIELPDSLQYMMEDSTGGGLGIVQFCKKAVSELMTVGRFGVLVDYPSVPTGLSIKDINDQNIRPTFKHYAAETIINWKETVINGVSSISQVVLVENQNVPIDDYSHEVKQAYRVLKLDDNGHYIQEVHKEWDDEVEIIEQRGSDGKPMRFIPFLVLGSVNNDIDVDPSPLYDLAEVNVAHLRNSADYEESIHMLGQPQPVITGLSQTWADKIGGVLKFGVRQVWSLPKDSKAEILHANANTLAREGMTDKEEMMRALGARIVDRQGAAETAQAARIKFSADSSVLSILVGNVSAGFEQLLKWAGLYISQQPIDVSFSVNQDFYQEPADPVLMGQMLNMFDRSIISKQDVRKELRLKRLIDENRTDEDIDNDISESSPIA